MTGVREGMAGPARIVGPGVRGQAAAHRARRLRRLRLLGAVGTAAAVLAASTLVLAEDDAGIRAFHRNEAARWSPSPAASYAPSRSAFPRPPAILPASGRFAPRALGRPVRSAIRDHGVPASLAYGGRTICVRLCDGFHAPVGQLRSQADFRAHEALCEAQNPGVPVKLFRLASGATTVTHAVAGDGTSYASLPAAYAYEQAADPTCRPPIASPGERRVSLLRDITLRPGDSIVLDGKVATFSGASAWPYRPGDFEDFRLAGKLAAGTKRMIDETVGISQAEIRQSLLRQSLQVREAPRDLASLAELRGTLAPEADEPAPLRQMMLR